MTEVRATTPAEKPTAIRIVIVNADGTSTNGPLIPLPTIEKRTVVKSNYQTLTLLATLEKFRAILRGEDEASFENVIDALNRHDCWREALLQLQREAPPHDTIAASLLSFWFTYGQYSIPKALKGNLIYLVDAFRHFLPPYTGPAVALFRGELRSRHEAGIYGISWTPNRDVARMFASRRSPDEGQGVVLQIEASPSMIVAAISDHSQHTLYLGENEYLVDPRALAGKVIVVE